MPDQFFFLINLYVRTFWTSETCFIVKRFPVDTSQIHRKRKFSRWGEGSFKYVQLVIFGIWSFFVFSGITYFTINDNLLL